jgi:mannose-1-phosphate guanylyltransferase
MTVGILLVGGFGTRLKPLTNESPKPMLPVAGLPVTEHQILAAKKAGIHTLVLATSYLAEVFTPYFGDGAQWGIKILYAVEKQPLGTGGAIRNAAQLLGRDEPIVVFNGDVLSRHSIADQCVPTDDQGRVTAFLEKMESPVSHSINAGCYVFSPDVIDEIPLATVVSVERETFPKLVADARAVFGYKDQSYWLDVGNPAALFQGSRDLIDGDFQAMPGTTIAPDAIITGGTSIGSDCSIGAGVRIHDCIIGNNVTIGDGADLSQSFILHGTNVQAGVKKSHHYLSTTADLPISL